MSENVTMKQLLEAGVHFGHQSRRWNPKMAKYIFTERNGIYIIDLKKTLRLLREAMRFVRESVALGKRVLFVGTKKQARESLQNAARGCGMYYVNNRWLGGMLTNFATIRRSINRLIELEAMWEDGTINRYSKKEISRLEREKTSLAKNLSGVKNMKEVPGVLFIVDPHKENIAVNEARKLQIPIVAIVDTNCDPDVIDYVIPGNDDAIRAIKLMCEQVKMSSIEGLMELQAIEGVEPEGLPPEIAASLGLPVPESAVPVSPAGEGTPIQPGGAPEEKAPRAAEPEKVSQPPAPVAAPVSVDRIQPPAPEAAPGPEPSPVPAAPKESAPTEKIESVPKPAAPEPPPGQVEKPVAPKVPEAPSTPSEPVESPAPVETTPPTESAAPSETAAPKESAPPDTPTPSVEPEPDSNPPA